MYTLNDFFCGCGGLGLGFQNAGFKIVGAWDFDKYAVATYRENVGDHVVQADIQKMHIEDVPKADVWAFGFPCQDLSVAGKQAGIKLECADCGTVWEVSAETYSEENLCPGCGGTNHKAATRSGMFFEIMRLLAEAREREREQRPQGLPEIEVIGMLESSGHDHSRRVHDPEGISPTATAVAGGTHHIKIFDHTKYRVRKLTPTEYGRLQAFPMDNWKQVVSNSQAYKQFGNAVTVTLAEGIGKSVIGYLDSVLGGAAV